MIDGKQPLSLGKLNEMDTQYRTGFKLVLTVNSTVNETRQLSIYELRCRIVA